MINGNKINGVKTNNGTFNADIVINASGAWSSLISQDLIPNFEVKPIHGQMVSLQADKKILEKVIFASILGKGARFPVSPNLNLPLIHKKIAPAFCKSLNHFVDVSILKSITIVFPSLFSSMAFETQGKGLE